MPPRSQYSRRCAAFELGEANREMAREICKRIFEQFGGAERNGDARRRDADRRIPRDRIDEVRRHERRRVPVAGIVLRGAEREVAHGGDPHAESAAGHCRHRRQRAAGANQRVGRVFSAAQSVRRRFDRARGRSVTIEQIETEQQERIHRGAEARCVRAASAASNRAMRLSRAGSAG